MEQNKLEETVAATRSILVKPLATEGATRMQALYVPDMQCGAEIGIAGGTRAAVNAHLAVLGAPVLKHTASSKEMQLQAYLEELAGYYAEEYDCKIPGFKVVYINRKTKSTLGRYDPITAVIAIFNHDGNSAEELHTCIHELAHHLQHRIKAVDNGKTLRSPDTSHGKAFQLHFYRLLKLARAKGYYTEPYMADSVLSALANDCRGLKRGSGENALRLGELFSQARDRCREVGASFELFLLEGCNVHRSLAYDYIKAWELKLPAELGVLKLRFVLRTQDSLRNQAIRDILDGVPMDIVKLRYRPKPTEKPLKPEETQWNPALELEKVRKREQQLIQELRSVKKRRIELETRLDQAAVGSTVSNDSTRGIQSMAARTVANGKR